MPVSGVSAACAPPGFLISLHIKGFQHPSRSAGVSADLPQVRWIPNPGGRMRNFRWSWRVGRVVGRIRTPAVDRSPPTP